jgi:hypothetical protein
MARTPAAEWKKSFYKITDPVSSQIGINFFFFFFFLIKMINSCGLKDL